MNRNKILPLTETTFYIMISLINPSHGYAIMQKVEELSGGRVQIAAGTMYGATENLLKQKLIREVPGDDKRRRVYILTDIGKDVLKLEVKRLKQLVVLADDLL
ncbi:PadR family transcriptional regulator [Enterococcus ureilyticus]|uniref:PadR family transcriptional regulator n=1 Tax=Enterococcus ureilyticus TaxID=1131292 RepID=A0A1E5HBZ1_9ENTE|nr:PadR family transcriptional regulator [Enterococcus ureilyticus]MBM7690220.1 DNA-binding PadR family transcriptional regulator [Enterococcus ureilyticus]OEG22471.1 PadR family transcriptional regulator [Enterococcus ureilyticus]